MELIRRDFGDVVADMVSALSDTDETPKPPWRARKEEYLCHLEEAPIGVLRVSDVRASQRLTTSASCLVAGSHGPDRELERLLARQSRGAGTKPSVR